MNQKLNQIHSCNQTINEDESGLMSPNDSIMTQNFFIINYSDPDTYVSIHELYNI